MLPAFFFFRHIAFSNFLWFNLLAVFEKSVLYNNV